MSDLGHSSSFLQSLRDKTVCVLPDDIEGLDAACKAVSDLPSIPKLQVCYNLEPKGSQQQSIYSPNHTITVPIKGTLQTSTPPSLSNSTAPLESSSTAPLSFLSMTLHITQAPAILSLPVMKKRSMGVFKVRITCISSMQANVPVLVRAHCIDEKSILKFEKSGTTWIPPPNPVHIAMNNNIDSNTGIVETELSWNCGGEVPQERLMVLVPKEGPASCAAAAALTIDNVDGGIHLNGCSTTTPTTTSADNNNASPPPPPPSSSSLSTQQLYEASDDVIFNNMMFNFPSQMKPRWIVFTAELPPSSTGRVVASCLLKVPTIVMSRVTDQLQKAKATLWGCGNNNTITKHSHLLLQHTTTTTAAAATTTEIINIKSFKREVRKVLANAQFNRNFVEEEFNFLEAKAGFRYHHYGSNGTGARLATTISAENATLAIDWLKANLATCSFFKELYERTNPQIICAFHIQREQTKMLLQDKDPGTFLIRFGSEPGSLVVSIKASSSLAMWRPYSSVGGVAPPPPHPPPPPSSSTSTTTTTGDWIDHIQLPRDVFLRAALEELLVKVADGNARFLLDANSQKVYTRQNVLERSYMQIMPCIVHKPAPLILNGGAVKVTAAGAAGGDDADGDYDYNISDDDDDDVPMMKKQRTTEPHSKFLGCGDCDGHDTKMMMLVNSSHEGSPLCNSMLNDNQVATVSNVKVTHQHQEDGNKANGGASFLLPRPLNGLAAANHFALSRNSNNYNSNNQSLPLMVVPMQLNAGGGSSLAPLSSLIPCPSSGGEADRTMDMSAILVAAAFGGEGRGGQRREGSMECLHGSLAGTPTPSSPDDASHHPAHHNASNNTNPAALVSEKPFSIEAFLAANNNMDVHPISDQDMNMEVLLNDDIQPPPPPTTTTTTTEQQQHQHVFGHSAMPSSPALMFDSELMMKDGCEIDLDFLSNFTH